jgi:hypothetical protein
VRQGQVADTPTVVMPPFPVAVNVQEVPIFKVTGVLPLHSIVPEPFRSPVQL